MYHKLKKDVGTLKVGGYIDVHEVQKEDMVSRGIIDEEGFEENPDAPKVAEAKIEPGVTSTSDILNNTKEAGISPVNQSNDIKDFVNPDTLEALAELKELAEGLAEKEVAYESAKADFEQAKADFQEEKTSFETEKADFEQAKADFLISKTETNVESPKGKPGPKAKETK